MNAPTQAQSNLRAVAAAQAGGGGNGVVAKRSDILTLLNDPKVKTGIGHVIGKLMTPERLLRIAINAVHKTPKLAECDPKTVLGAVMTTAALGLEPNTVQQQAFLIPYKRNFKDGNQWRSIMECQFQIGARGFVTLAYRSPRVLSLTAGAIHEGDEFDHCEGSGAFLRFKKSLLDRGDLIGAFSYVKLRDGAETACVLPLEEVLKIRSRSETFRTLSQKFEDAERGGNAKDLNYARQQLEDTPWMMWADDMFAKSAIKKHAKQLPVAAGENLASAADIDDQANAGTLDLSAMADPDVARSVMEDGTSAPMLERGNTGDELIDQGTGEVFGTRERQAVARGQEGANQQQGRQAEQARPAFDTEAYEKRILGCKDADMLDVLLDGIRHAPEESQAKLRAAYEAAKGKLSK